MLLFGRVRHWLFALYLFVVLVLEFQVLVERMEQRLEVAISTSRRHKRTYSSRRRLRRDMVGDHPVYSLFVSGSNIRSDEKFYCPICHRDVSMRSRGAGEFSRHFFLTDTGRQIRRTEFVKVCLSSISLWIPCNCGQSRLLITCHGLAKALLKDLASAKTCCLLARGWGQ